MDSEKERKSSPEQGSSDSDDSLPPYPIGDLPTIDTDTPLPPPPPPIEDGYERSSLKKSVPPTNPQLGTETQPKYMLNYSAATYKTVSAPQTSVAVSRTLQAPQPKIADSPRLPMKSFMKTPDTSP